MSRGTERLVPHTGTETRSRLLREAAVRNIGHNGREPDPAMPREGYGPMGLKLLLYGSNKGHVWSDESTVRISIG